jgi:uncharacterized protein (DUF1697 family)
MKYIALLRGIGPGDPRMSNSNLRSIFASLGFNNVRTFISSGNVLFESNSSDVATLENKIEEALPKKLGFESRTIIRSEADLDEIMKKNPFQGMTHNQHTSLNITFLKDNKRCALSIPEKGKGYKIIDNLKGAICFVVDLQTERTPTVMALIEKAFDKKVTTRTWNTVSRIYALMSAE